MELNRQFQVLYNFEVASSSFSPAFNAKSNRIFCCYAFFAVVILISIVSHNIQSHKIQKYWEVGSKCLHFGHRLKCSFYAFAFVPRYNHSAHSVFDYQYLKRKTHSVCECDYVLVGVSEREMHGNGAIESVLLPFSGFISFVGFLVYAVITALAPVFFSLVCT